LAPSIKALFREPWTVLEEYSKVCSDFEPLGGFCPIAV
jgi:hypothetical protein